MNIDDIFAKSNTFTAEVEVNIPGKDKDRIYRPLVEYRYLDQNQLDALLAGEPVEIDGQEVASEDDASLLDKVLVGWTRWKADGQEIEYSPDNHAKALKHAPIRTAMVMKFLERLSGGGRGGKRGKRKNS
jgi:hypothetical protein